MNQQEIFKQIAAERLYQDGKWGATDHLNTEYNWAAYIGHYTNRRLAGQLNDPARKAAFKADMIKVAALAVAAAEKL